MRFPCKCTPNITQKCHMSSCHYPVRTENLILFPGPHCGIIFSKKKIEKNFFYFGKNYFLGSMKRIPNTQINAFSHWHLEISMSIFFLLWWCFSAQLDRWQALMQRPIIDQRPVKQTAYRREIKGLVTMDINLSLQILGLEQVLAKGIRQKSTKRMNSFIVCSAFCQGPPNRDPMDSEKRLHVYKSAATMARHTWRVDMSPGHTHRNRNACLKVLRFLMGKNFAGT